MAGELYIAVGSTVTFGGEVGDTVAFTLASLPKDTGQQSAQRDLGASPRSDRYKVRMYFQCATAPILGRSARLYLKTGDSATDHLQNDDGTGDAALSSQAKLANLEFLGECFIDEAAINKENVLVVPEVLITSQYIHFVVFNETGAAFTADDAENKVELTPIPYQEQA